MNPVSFHLANYFARQTGYNVTGGWGQGAQTTIAYFRPIETFAARFDEYLRDVRAIGFHSIDMWTDILGPPFATQQHIEAAQHVIREHELQVTSYGGWFGSTPEEFTAICELGLAFGSPVLGGSTSMLSKDRTFVIDTLKRYGLLLALENHPESPADIIDKIGDGGDGMLGT
jgi:sugar phosphate isomerase/epimerase